MCVCVGGGSWEDRQLLRSGAHAEHPEKCVVLGITGLLRVRGSGAKVRWSGQSLRGLIVGVEKGS